MAYLVTIDIEITQDGKTVKSKKEIVAEDAYRLIGIVRDRIDIYSATGIDFEIKIKPINNKINPTV